MLTIQPSLPATRRQRLHLVFRADDSIAYVGPDFAKLLRWLADNEEREALVETDDAVWKLSFERAKVRRKRAGLAPGAP